MSDDSGGGAAPADDLKEDERPCLTGEEVDGEVVGDVTVSLVVLSNTRSMYSLVNIEIGSIRLRV